ncbi:MAG: hypothetical protein ABL876_17130 [Chitinophagaceae bacterium]
MSFFSTTYKGFTITQVGDRYRISSMPYVDFLTLQAVKNYIDKLQSIKR